MDWSFLNVAYAGWQNVLEHCWFLQESRQIRGLLWNVTVARSVWEKVPRNPTVWCHVCGWVHFKCSGLSSPNDYEKSHNFRCTWCAKNTKLVASADPSFLRLQKIYTTHPTIKQLLARDKHWSRQQQKELRANNETTFYHKAKPTQSFELVETNCRV